MSIVLTGMPASGKSVLAKLLSKELGMPYIDIDKVIENKENMLIKDIFAKHGEAYFRDLETSAILSVSSGFVVSTGGGAVLRPENVSHLKSIGKIFFINRDIKLIRKANHLNRPLLNNLKDIENIYNARIDIYKSTADFIIDNNSTLKNALSQILLCLNQ